MPSQSGEGGSKYSTGTISFRMLLLQASTTVAGTLFVNSFLKAMLSQYICSGIQAENGCLQRGIAEQGLCFFIFFSTTNPWLVKSWQLLSGYKLAWSVTTGCSIGTPLISVLFCLKFAQTLPVGLWAVIAPSHLFFLYLAMFKLFFIKFPKVLEFCEARLLLFF